MSSPFPLPPPSFRLVVPSCLPLLCPSDAEIHLFPAPCQHWLFLFAQLFWTRNEFRERGCVASVVNNCMASELYDVAAVWDRTTSDPFVLQGPWSITSTIQEDLLCCYLPTPVLRKQPASGGVASQWLDDTTAPPHYSSARTLMHAPACTTCLRVTGVAVACPRREGTTARASEEHKWEVRCCAGCPRKHTKRCRRRNLQAAMLLEQAEEQSLATTLHLDQQAEADGDQ